MSIQPIQTNYLGYLFRVAKTHIGWINESWNPVTSCDKVSPGCKYCYAEEIFKRFWPDRPFIYSSTIPSACRSRCTGANRIECSSTR